LFDLINGIPLHPLVVHAVVVLLPLAILGTILIVARPSWRPTYGPLVVLSAAAATALMPVATSSGEALERRVGDPGKHAQLGDQLIWFTIPLLILVIALVVLDRRDRRGATDTPRTHGTDTNAGLTVTSTAQRTKGHPPLTSAVAVLAVLAAFSSGVQVYRVGDSGARAAWGDRVDQPAPRTR
jgi:hypothetical protein